MPCKYSSLDFVNYLFSRSLVLIIYIVLSLIWMHKILCFFLYKILILIGQAHLMICKWFQGSEYFLIVILSTTVSTREWCPLRSTQFLEPDQLTYCTYIPSCNLVLDGRTLQEVALHSRPAICFCVRLSHLCRIGILYFQNFKIS